MGIIDLRGLRVLNTRPLAQSQDLAARINAAGGVSINCPALEILPAKHAWFPRLPPLSQVHQAIFISVNAVHHSFKTFADEHLVWPAHILVSTLGQGTARALAQYNVPVHFTPSISDSEHLLKSQRLQAVHEQTILLFKGEGGRTLISNTLISRGARLIELAVYQRLMPSHSRENLEQLWRESAVDIILFTSEEALVNIFTLFGEAAMAWLKRTPCLVISQRLAKVAADIGIQTILVCSPESVLEGLIQFKGRIHG